MAGREFITAVEEKATGGPEPIEVPMGRTIINDDGEQEVVDRRTIIAHPPKEGQVAVMMARMGRHSTTNDKMAGVIDFFVDILNESDHNYVVGRLMDRDDPFGVTDITDIMTYLVEEWGKRPTKK